jgi:hypothetical protein
MPKHTENKAQTKSFLCRLEPAILRSHFDAQYSIFDLPHFLYFFVVCIIFTPIARSSRARATS